MSRKAADRVAPGQEVSKWNLTLLDFGAAVCTAKNPRCAECPLQQQCNYSIASIEAEPLFSRYQAEPGN